MLTTDSCISFKLSTITFKALGSGRPPYLENLLHNYSPPRTMRSSSAKLLTVPCHNLSLSSRAYSISAPTTWKSLPQNVCDCSSLDSFRNHRKTHYFSPDFSALWHLIHMRLDCNLTTALYKSFTYLLTYKKGRAYSHNEYIKHQTVLRERKPPPRHLTQPNVIQDSNPDFRINLDSDPDVCRITPRMLWIHLPCRCQSFCRVLWKIGR